MGTRCPPFFNRNNRNPEWFAQQRALNRQAAKDAAKASVGWASVTHPFSGCLKPNDSVEWALVAHADAADRERMYAYAVSVSGCLKGQAV